MNENQLGMHLYFLDFRSNRHRNVFWNQSAYIHGYDVCFVTQGTQSGPFHIERAVHWPVFAVDLVSGECVVKHEHFVRVLQTRPCVLSVLKFHRGVQQGQIAAYDQSVRTVCRAAHGKQSGLVVQDEIRVRCIERSLLWLRGWLRMSGGFSINQLLC